MSSAEYVACGLVVVPQDRVFFREPGPFSAGADPVARSDLPRVWSVAGCARWAVLGVLGVRGPIPRPRKLKLEGKNAFEVAERLAEGLTGDDGKESAEKKRLAKALLLPYAVAMTGGVRPGELLGEAAFFLGTWPVVVEVEDGRASVEEVLWPAPAHLVRFETEDRDEWSGTMRVWPVKKKRAEDGPVEGGVVIPGGPEVTRERGFRPPVDPAPGADLEGYELVDTGSLGRALREPGEELWPEDRKWSELLHEEVHVGITLERDRTVKEGHLYTASFLRPGVETDGGFGMVGFLTVLAVPKKLEEELEDGFEGVPKGLPNPAARTGRGRHAWTFRVEGWGEVLKPIDGKSPKSPDGVYLETPTPFRAGNLWSSAPDATSFPLEALVFQKEKDRDKHVQLEVRPVEVRTRNGEPCDRVVNARRVSTWNQLSNAPTPDLVAAGEGSVVACLKLEGKVKVGDLLLLFSGAPDASATAFHLGGVGTAYAGKFSESKSEEDGDRG